MHNTLPNLGALVVFFKEGQQLMLLKEGNVTTKSIGRVVVFPDHVAHGMYLLRKRCP